jgi:hypothetical protein
MSEHHPRRRLPFALGLIALASLAALLAWDVFPGAFPSGAHNVLGALPLALVAVAYLAHQAVVRPRPLEVVKASLLAIAFLLWAANQLWPSFRYATLCNDLAIVLFVLDIFAAILGWPSGSPD